jgi:hypothetical protein
MAAARSSDSASTQTEGSEWPGKRLGLPERGPRSVGRLGRRIAALAIDGAVADVIAFAFFNYDAWAILAILAVLQIAFIVLLSGSVGHLIVGLRVVPLTPGWVGVWRPALRTVLLCIVLPALIWDRDQRGLHDKIAGTVLVRR